MKKTVILIAILCIGAFSLIHAQSSTLDTTKTMAFDPTAATQKYLDLLSPAQKAKSDAYFEGGYWLILWDLLYALCVGFIFLRLGLSGWIKKLALKVKNVNLQNLIYGLVYLLLAWVLSFPISVYEGFFREHQYGLSNLTFSGWMIESLKALGISAVFGGFLLVILYIAIRRTGKRWWIWGAGISIFWVRRLVLNTQVQCVV
jgi:STE24 endopeptidase